MSISGTRNSGNKGQEGGSAMSGAFARAREQQTQDDNQGAGFGGDFGSDAGGDDTWEFLNPGSNGLFTVAESAAGEHLSKLEKGLKEIFKDANPQTRISLIPMSMETNTQYLIDTLVVVCQLEQAPQLGVAYHPILLAGSIPKLEDVAVQVALGAGGTSNVTETRVEGDIADGVFYEQVKEEVQRQFPGVNTFMSFGEVLPRTFNFEDEAALQKVARNSSMAAAITLQKFLQARPDLNLAKVKKGAKLTLRSNFGQANELDRVGLPVRSDIIVSLQAEAANQGGQPQQKRAVAATRQAQVARVQAFVDLVWSPTTEEVNPFFQVPQNGGFGQNNQQQNNPYQKYIPRIVVTGLTTNNPPTTAVQLLSWLLSTYISEGGQWVHAFTQRNYRSISKELNLRDIGAMAIEANFENNPNGLGERVDTTLDSFQPKLPAYLAAIIRPEPVISIDVSECGADTWMNGFLALAAEEQQEALDEIFDAANTLTNTRFGENWAKYISDNGDPGQLFWDEDNRVHAGYFLDGEGKPVDIREIDYLAVLNRFGGGTEHDVVKRWSDSFISDTDPLLRRLENRKRIIDMMTGNQAVYTGFYRRISVAHAFMEVLALSCKQAGLEFTTISSHQQLRSATRAAGSFSNFAFSGNRQSGLYNRSGFQTNQGGGFSGGNRRFGF